MFIQEQKWNNLSSASSFTWQNIDRFNIYASFKCFKIYLLFFNSRSRRQKIFLIFHILQVCLIQNSKILNSMYSFVPQWSFNNSTLYSIFGLKVTQVKSPKNCYFISMECLMGTLLKSLCQKKGAQGCHWRISNKADPGKGRRDKTGEKKTGTPRGQSQQGSSATNHRWKLTGSRFSGDLKAKQPA